MIPPPNETSDYCFSEILDKDTVPRKEIKQPNDSLYMLLFLLFIYFSFLFLIFIVLIVILSSLKNLLLRLNPV